MFWGYFLYDKKGPCHIWEEETTKEKKEAKIYMERENKKNEPTKREEWELEITIPSSGETCPHAKPGGSRLAKCMCFDY